MNYPEPGPKVEWERCASCNLPFETDSVDERFYNPKGVVHKECMESY